MSTINTDVVVIGAGAVGENVAGRTVRGGLATVMVEAELVGGECSYWACMPSKALLRPGEALETIKAIPGARAAVTGALDAQQVLDWRNAIASSWDDAGQVEWTKGAGIELVRGHAVVSGVREVTVTPEEGEPITITATHAVVVATGSVPVVPPVEGLPEAPYWTSREATSAQEVPASLAVLGGGVVGVELSQAWASLGSRVTLIARGGLLERNEPWVGGLIQESLEKSGVTVITGASVTAVAVQGDQLRVSTDQGETVVADRLLVAAGRSAATRDLGLEAFGLEPGRSLEVDDSGRVLAVPEGWLYAAGDVNGRVLLTHQGKYQARAIGDVIAARAAGRVGDTVEPWSPYAMTADHEAVPQVVFTRPQVAAVGLTVAQAQEKYAKVRAIDIPIAVAGGSVHSEGYSGRAVLVIDDERSVVVGATFVGEDVDNLLHSATIAVVGEVPLSRLWHAVPSYPTISEVWLRLLEAAGL
jgi:pyruvate/2-oxoglutarate dehydrogenase complex dihydrolipoamide dehydrogenase (E3) component